MPQEYVYDLVVKYKDGEIKEIYNYETLEESLAACKALYTCDQTIDKITIVQNRLLYDEKEETLVGTEQIAFTDIVPNYIEEE